MPKTLTQIKTEEAADRERAHEFEEALNRKSNYEGAVSRLEPYVPRYEKQLAAIGKMEAALEDLDPTINIGGVHGLVKGTLRDLLTRARNDQQRRLDETSAALARTRQELKKAIVALKVFED
jgi:hypothetical protein